MNAQTILTSARVDCYRTIPHYYSTKNLAAGPWRIADYPGMAYDAHPRQRWIASDFGPVLGKGGTGWKVPGGDSDHVAPNYDVTRMMIWFAFSVRDALAFNY